jgi:hypothetical protein
VIAFCKLIKLRLFSEKSQYGYDSFVLRNLQPFSIPTSNFRQEFILSKSFDIGESNLQALVIMTSKLLISHLLMTIRALVPAECYKVRGPEIYYFLLVFIKITSKIFLFFV